MIPSAMILSEDVNRNTVWKGYIELSTKDIIIMWSRCYPVQFFHDYPIMLSLLNTMVVI